MFTENNDSKISPSFSVEKTKASYVVNHGLTLYFEEMLQKEIKRCCNSAVCFLMSPSTKFFKEVN